MYEDQLRGYFSQFGDITRLRLSRNKKVPCSDFYYNTKLLPVTDGTLQSLRVCRVRLERGGTHRCRDNAQLPSAWAYSCLPRRTQGSNPSEVVGGGKS